MHMPLVQLHPNCWEAFKLHVMSSRTLTVISKCQPMAEKDCLFLFKQVTDHTHTHTQSSSTYSPFTDMFSHSTRDWIESSQVCAELTVIRNRSERPSLVRTLTYQAQTGDTARQLSSKGICLVCTVDMFTVEWNCMCQPAGQQGPVSGSWEITPNHFIQMKINTVTRASFTKRLGSRSKRCVFCNILTLWRIFWP